VIRGNEIGEEAKVGTKMGLISGKWNCKEESASRKWESEAGSGGRK
jgi:hypothetical protein